MRIKIRRNGQPMSIRTAGQSNRAGVGSELLTMLAWMKNPAKQCGCQARARELDRLGIDWCDEHRDVVVAWLREGATELGVPFHELPARWAIHIAIQRARKKATEARPLP